MEQRRMESSNFMLVCGFIDCFQYLNYVSEAKIFAKWLFESKIAEKMADNKI